jgi:hypothetical protein
MKETGISVADVTEAVQEQMLMNIARSLNTPQHLMRIVSISDARKRLLAVSVKVQALSGDTSSANQMASKAGDHAGAVVQAFGEGAAVQVEVTSAVEEPPVPKPPPPSSTPPPATPNSPTTGGSGSANGGAGTGGSKTGGAGTGVSHTSGPYKGYLTVVARKLPFIDWWPKATVKSLVAHTRAIGGPGIFLRLEDLQPAVLELEDLQPAPTLVPQLVAVWTIQLADLQPALVMMKHCKPSSSSLRLVVVWVLLCLFVW